MTTNYSNTYIFDGNVQRTSAASSDNDLVRKSDVASNSFITSIAANSSNFLSVSEGALSVSNLLVTDVKVNTGDSTLANYVSNSASGDNLGVGDIVILTNPTPNEMYIVKTNDGTSVNDYQKIESGLTAAQIVSVLSAGSGIAISGSGEISSTITQYADSNARAALSAGSGISYNNATGQISSTITQYADSNARAALSVGAGLTYNNATGVFACSITQYADSNARAALSAGTGLNYNNATGEFSSSITQYTDANARAAFTGGDGITLSAGGAISVDQGSSLEFAAGKLEVKLDSLRVVLTNQSFTADTEKTIQHDLGQKYVHVSVYNSSDQLIHLDQKAHDADNVKLTSTSNLTGCSIVISV